MNLARREGRRFAIHGDWRECEPLPAGVDTALEPCPVERDPGTVIEFAVCRAAVAGPDPAARIGPRLELPHPKIAGPVSRGERKTAIDAGNMNSPEVLAAGSPREAVVEREEGAGKACQAIVRGIAPLRRHGLADPASHTPAC